MNSHDIALAILNHSDLKIACRIYGESQAQNTKLRYHEIVGMIELARQLDAVDNALLDALEAHRDELKAQLKALGAG